MASEGIRVRGLRDLQRAFALADRDEAKGLRTALKEVAEPVRSTAEQLATSSIPNIGIPWSRMRVGVTRNLVYVAPRERGRRGKSHRPNLAGLLMDRAMQPALDANESKIEQAVEQMLDEVGHKWERA